MDDVGSTVSALQEIFSLVTNSPWSATLTAIGLFLLVLGVVIAVKALKSDAATTPLWLKFGLFFCLIGGVCFSGTGPVVALVSYSRFPIQRVPPAKAFDNLETNERIRWLIRLIPFDPDAQPDLAIGHLTQLGPPEQAYTFVAAYDELVGYGVDEAVRMTGGTYSDGQRVSAIIFPLAGRQIHPANARGLLQVIQSIETSANKQIATPLLTGTSALKPEEETDLKNIKALNYWRWDNYFNWYPDYCQLAQTFRCDPKYSAHNYLGGPNIDWDPHGLALKDTQQDPCDIKPVTTYCRVSDPASAKSSWQSTETTLMKNFGSRVFLMENLSINSIKDRVLIDFGEPTQQYIPDIGLRSHGQ